MKPPLALLPPPLGTSQGAPVPRSPARPFRRIVVCVDGSRMADVAIRHARLLADAFRSPLTLLRVLETGFDPIDAVDWDVRRREAQAELDRAIARLGDRQDLAVDTYLMQGQAAPQIFQWAAVHEADLTALASHGEHGQSPWALASTARKLVEQMPGSLLLVPGESADRPGRYQRILVPLDGSPRAERALDPARQVARAHEAELLLVHVVPEAELTVVAPPTAQDVELQQRLTERNERVGAAYLDRLRARLQAEGVRVRVRLAHGEPRTRLATIVADEGADLVVLSAHGHRGLEETGCGSVAAYLVGHVRTPLLVLGDGRRRLRRAPPTGRQVGDLRRPSGRAVS